MPDSVSWGAAIASDGNTTFVAFSESEARDHVPADRRRRHRDRLAAAAAVAGHRRRSEHPRSRSRASNVYVAWIQGSYSRREKHAVVAASHDGGRTFAQAVMAGRADGRRRLGPPSSAADGDNVFVAFVDDRDRLWTAGSRDGGRTLPVHGRDHRRPATSADGGGDYYARRRRPARALGLADRRLRHRTRAARPTAAARSSRPASCVDSPAATTTRASPNDRRRRRHRRDRLQPAVPDAARGQDRHRLGLRAQVLTTSQDGGDNWAEQHIGGEGDRCIGDYCAAPYGLDVDGHRRLRRLARQGHDVARALAPTAACCSATRKRSGRYIYTWHTPHAPYVWPRAATRWSATWHTRARPDAATRWTRSPPFSSDHGRTFTLRTIDDGAGQDLVPGGAAWGPDPQGAGFAWMSLEQHLLQRRHATCASCR